MAGAIFGSFIATLALRWPQGRSMVHGRSACDGCGRTLAVIDLVPLVSWLVLRGRCRTCGAEIAGAHIVIELVAATIGGVALGFIPNLGGAALALFGWQLLLLGWLDARHWWLPHALSAILAVSGLMFGGVAMAALGLDATLIDRVIGMVGGFAALALIALVYRALRGREGLGGGDAPLLGAIGAWVGWAVLPLVLLLAALAGIAVALMHFARKPVGDAGEPIGQMRLPLGTLMAMATPFAVIAIRVLALD
ncbi:MAG: prepilin peptidase [Pseudomonadota bacterium]